MAQNLLVPQLRKFARNVCLVLTCPVLCFCENVGFYPNLDSSFICQLPQLHSVLSYTHFLLHIFYQYVEHQLCAKIRSVIQWRGDILFTLILDRGGNDRGLAPSGEAGTGQQAGDPPDVCAEWLLELELPKTGAQMWDPIFKKAKYGNILCCENVPEAGEQFRAWDSS